MALSYSMDKIGPMAGSAEDCARIFAVIAGHDPKDRSTLPLDKAAFTYTPALELKARPLRIGWLTNAWKQMDSGVPKALAAARAALRKHSATVRGARLPIGPYLEAGNSIIFSQREGYC